MPLFGQTEANLSGVLADPSGAATPRRQPDPDEPGHHGGYSNAEVRRQRELLVSGRPAPGTYSVFSSSRGYARLEHKDIVDRTASERTRYHQESVPSLCWHCHRVVTV